MTACEQINCNSGQEAYLALTLKGDVLLCKECVKMDAYLIDVNDKTRKYPYREEAVQKAKERMGMREGLITGILKARVQTFMR